jgi:hypothetical protein
MNRDAYDGLTKVLAASPTRRGHHGRCLLGICGLNEPYSDSRCPWAPTSDPSAIPFFHTLQQDCSTDQDCQGISDGFECPGVLNPRNLLGCSSPTSARCCFERL